MDLAELLTEFYAFGFDDLNDGGVGEARATRLINETHRTLCAGEAWPFLEASASGAAPLTVADLRFVRTVVDTGRDRALEYVSGDDIRLEDPGVDRDGAPLYWYRSSSTEIAVYPTDATTIRVDYLKRPAALVNDADTPLLPEEWHFLIVKGAALRAGAYKGNADTESAQMLRVDYDRELQEMREALLIGQRELESVHVATDWMG